MIPLSRPVRIGLATLILAAGATGASAYDRSDRIDAREANQARRIENARRSGELTWWESMRLRGEQRRIHRMERQAERDGHISREEARRIENAQDAASRNIYRQSHDHQTARWRRW
jgi:hypothetical protein